MDAILRGFASNADSCAGQDRTSRRGPPHDAAGRCERDAAPLARVARDHGLGGRVDPGRGGDAARRASHLALTTTPAMANGGAGSAGLSAGGAGGIDSPTDPGGMGGTALGSGGGGGAGATGGGGGNSGGQTGGAGGSSAGSAGAAGGNGSGVASGRWGRWRGGAHGFVGTTLPGAASTGGAGGNGGNGVVLRGRGTAGAGAPVAMAPL